MPRKFIDVYDLQDHTNEMKTEIVPEIVKEVGGTGGSGTATNIADWAEKDSTTAIPIDKKLALPEDVPAAVFESSEHADDTSVSLGSLFERIFYMVRTAGAVYPDYPIDYSEIVEESAWESYVNACPALFSVDTANTSSGTSTVVGIHTTIEKITDTLVKLMSSSGSSSGSSNTLPLIVSDTFTAPQSGSSAGLTSTQTYSSFNTIDLFDSGKVYNSSDEALASAFLDGVFSGSIPSYFTGTFGTAKSGVASSTIFYPFKITIDSINDNGLCTCTVYYLNTKTDGSLTTVSTTVKSKTTMPFLVKLFS